MKYACHVAYDGASYLGFQRQKKGGDIQSALEDFLSFYLKKNTLIKAAGRTDRGVHALAQVIAFESPRELEPEKFIHYARGFLPKDISILDIREVPESFDPRHSCKGKIYEYRFCLGQRDPFMCRYRTEMEQGLDLPLFEETLQLYEGEHNFRRFCGKPEDLAGFVREIRRVKLRPVGTEWRATFEGNGFMRHMVRSLIGAAFYVGYGKLPLSAVKEALAHPEGERLPYLAAPEGLYLVSVLY